jgi:cytoskeleton protein RodZ
MPDIGATLREARMRARIDISEIEAETKIRAKYLRALENEEWDLLPGPTYVRTFLRTYAEALGLDARLMVEEYRLRHERVSEQELLPISPGTARAARERRPRPPRFGRGWLIGIVVVALAAALFFLGRSGSGNDPDPDSARGPATTATTTRAPASRPVRKRAKPAAPRNARVQIVPTAPVYVCLIDARGRRLLDGALLDAGSPRRVYRSRAFRLTLGNGSAALRVNGVRRDVPDVSDGIGYRITGKGVKRLSPAARPTCSS